MTSELVVVAAIALAAAIIALAIAGWLRRWRGSRRAQARAARAGAGETAAAALLVARGYRIVERQARVSWAPLVDGVPHATELRADYLVIGGDGRELLVAEVKTGDVAPSLDAAATRRQLLEYYCAFGADGILLVCPERDAIHRVEFAIMPATTGARGRGRTSA